MTCPSCNFTSPTQTDFCVRCGFSAAKMARALRACAIRLAWVLRRSLRRICFRDGGLVGHSRGQPRGRRESFHLRSFSSFRRAGGILFGIGGRHDGRVHVKNASRRLCRACWAASGSVIASWMVQGKEIPRRACRRLSPHGRGRAALLVL